MGNPLLVSVDSDTNLFPEAVRKANSVAALVDRFGAKANGTDDTAAIQAAFDAVNAAGGGTVVFSPGKTYGLLGTVQIGSNTVIDGNGATIQKLYGGTSTTFVNYVASGAVGYGSGAKNITFQDLRIKGNYDAAGVVDGSTGWNHVDNLNFLNVKFEELQQNAHAVDLGGCRNVKFIGCTFAGLKTVAGREYVEAIQVDSSSYIGSSWKSWPTNSYDGLPTRGVLVDGCTFTTYTKNGTVYGMPNPIGQHGAILTTDDGYYEDIRFVNNRVEGWNTTPAIGSTLSYGWCHFRGVRNLIIQGNHFKYTGPSGVTGQYPTAINVVPVTAAYDISVVAQQNPSTSPVNPPRNPVNVNITGNVFEGFGNAPVQSGTAIISVTGALQSTCASNSVDGASATVIQSLLSSGGNTNESLMVTGNTITSSSTDPMIQMATPQLAMVKGNKLVVPSGGVGILVDSGNACLTEGNIITGGATGILYRGTSNSAIANNLLISQTAAGVSLGPAGATPNTTYTSVSGNYSRSAATGSVGLVIGSTSTFTQRWGNRWRSATGFTDAGANSAATGYADQTA